MGIKKDSFPSREGFYKNILKLKVKRELRKEGEYLAYLKAQRMRKKPRRLRCGDKEFISNNYRYSVESLNKVF